MGFSGGDGVYHSIYDSFTWMKLVDPNFVYHRAQAQLWGAMFITLSDISVAPLYYTDTASALTSYLTVTKQSLSGYSTLPFDLSALEQSIYTFGQGAYQVQQNVFSTSTGSIQNARGLNAQLYDTERLFLTDGGLPQRFWYKHTLQAPGISSGYGSESFPGLTFAISNQDWTLAQEQANLIADRVNAAAFHLIGPESHPLRAAVIGLSFAFGFTVLLVTLAFIKFRFDKRSDDMELVPSDKYQSVDSS